jgi:hypothetical protein
MRRWSPLWLLTALALSGCGKPAALQRGDVVRPQLALAPDAPWPAGCKAAIGILVEVHRPGRPGVGFLREEDVPPEGAVMRAKVTFLAGDVPLAEPLEVPFVRDC